MFVDLNSDLFFFQLTVCDRLRKFPVERISMKILKAMLKEKGKHRLTMVKVKVNVDLYSASS